MGKKTKKPGKGKEKTERKTARAEEKKARRETKKLSPEDDIDAILVLSLSPISHLKTKHWNLYLTQLSIQKEEAKKKEVHVDDNVPAPSPRSNCSVTNAVNFTHSLIHSHLSVALRFPFFLLSANVSC